MFRKEYTWEDSEIDKKFFEVFCRRGEILIFTLALFLIAFFYWFIAENWYVGVGAVYVILIS